jgi:uncharacterized protein DUF6312
MDLTRSIRRIIILNRDDSGQVVPAIVFERGRKKKKGTRLLRPLERLTRRWAEANNVVSERYIRDHREANVKRRDGWVRAFNRNIVRANRKGLKKLDPARLVGF